MKKVNVEYSVYQFDELEKKAQDKVINEYIKFVLETTDMDTLDKKSNLYKAISKAEEMRTPWFTGSYIWEYCEEEVLSAVRDEEYFVDGKLFKGG